MAKKLAFISLFLIVAAGLWSAEGDSVFEITNATGFVLEAVYIGSADSNVWNDDLLQGNPLLDGETLRIPLLSLEAAIVNVRARDEEGDTYTVWGVNAETEDIEIALTDIDPD